MAIAPLYVTPIIAARTLGVPLAWLRAEAGAGRIPHLRAGRRLLFNIEAVRHALIRRAELAERLTDE